MLTALEEIRMYKIRAILDTTEDVIRTLMVDEKMNLEELHKNIATSFGFHGNEMASFYFTDDEWNQGEEIPLFNMSEFGDTLSMNMCVLSNTLPKVNDKLIYVYDFFKLWSFYIEVIDISDDSVTDTKIIMSVGTVPEEAPKKEFIAENTEENELDDEFDSYDDFDFNNF